MSKSSDDVDANRQQTVRSWNADSDVLSLKSFPGTSILRYGAKGTHLCKCAPEKRHRSLFDVNLLFTAGNLVGKQDCPEISVCHNAENIWECVLPREITNLNKRVAFDKLPNVRTAMAVLKKGTYWYRQCCKSKRFAACAFQRHMARFLAGLPSREGKEPFKEVKQMRVNPAAVQRFRSMLATVDGLLMQITLSFPGEESFQNWETIDRIQRGLILNILEDYFKDCDVNRITIFEKIKNLRKQIKEHGFNPASDLRKVVVPRELSALRTVCSLVRGSSPLTYLQVSILCQTRASGVPPRLLYERTMAETTAILTTPSDKNLYEEVKRPLMDAVDHLYGELLQRVGGADFRDKFFSEVVKTSKISLSDSGEFFTNTADGGKLERARVVLRNNPEIPEIDLHTGRKTGVILTSANTQGERLFHWACNQFTDRSKIYEKNCMSCRISLVAELGKYRTITVSTLQHALFLHPFSHMGLKILEAFPSSESGIGAANHSWNFFKRLSHKNPSASFIFNEDIQTSVFSTDWEQATNHCDPYIAGAILNRFSSALGVPKWYRETMVFALTAPRQVETLDRNNAPIKTFYTKRGVLMGDPVTKPVLHLHHLVGAKVAGILLFEVFQEDVLDEDSENSDVD